MIDPELQPFLDAWNDSHAQLAPDATIQQRRDCIEKLAQDMRLPTPSDIDAKTEHWIESRPRPVRARVFRHKDGGTQPCLIYMHGGSFMVGSPETVWDSAAAIASRNRQTVICIAYDKAPEHPFPAAIHQCAAVVEWAFDNAADLGIDPDRIAIGGESAGASLAAAMTLKFRGTARRLTAQLLVYPAVDYDLSRPSYQEHANGPIITTTSFPAVIALYCPNPEDRNDPMAAPLLAEHHRDLPPAYIALAENDPLRDAGYAYADALRAAGVPVVLDPGKGLIHGYMRAAKFSSAVANSVDRMSDWLAARNRGEASA